MIRARGSNLLLLALCAAVLFCSLMPAAARAASTVDLLRVARQYSSTGQLLNDDTLTIFPDEGDVELEVNKVSAEGFISSSLRLVGDNGSLLLGENMKFDANGVWKTTIPRGTALAEGQYRLVLEYTYISGERYVYIHGGQHRLEDVISEPQSLGSNAMLTVKRGAYVAGQDGKPAWSWQNDGTNLYCIINGQKATGWQLLDGKWYLFANDGRMLKGWQKVKGKWYYLTDAGMTTGWLYDKGKWYYMKGSGAMVTGWYSMSTCWYYFSAGGAMRTGWIKDKGNWYYLSPYGTMVTGYSVVEGKVHSFTASGRWLGEAKGYVNGPLL